MSEKKRANVNGVFYEIGKEYIVLPNNPSKMKHRNRECVLIEFDDEYMPHIGSVKFKDNNRSGKVTIVDLKPLN